MAANSRSTGHHGNCNQAMPKITNTLIVFLAILGVPMYVSTRVNYTVLSSIAPKREPLESGQNFGSFGIDLMHIHHIDSPYAETNLSFSKRIELLLNSDKERLNYLANQVHEKHFSFGMDHQFVSPVFTNSIGLYLMQINFGSPKRIYHVIVDTGSDLVWVKCWPCDGCSNLEKDFFNPVKDSFSYKDMLCTEPLCKVTSGAKTSCSPKTNLCKYSMKYKDNSESKGDLAYETFSLDWPSGTIGKYFYRFAFGCSRSSKKSDIHGAVGIAGLSRGKLSLISQMGIFAFSYCLIEFHSATTKKSNLFLNPEIHKSPLQFRYTPLEYPSNFFYSINLMGIDVNDKPIIFPKGFDIKAGGNGAYLVDVGTVLTTMLPTAYKTFRDILTNSCPQI